MIAIVHVFSALALQPSARPLDIRARPVVRALSPLACTSAYAATTLEARESSGCPFAFLHGGAPAARPRERSQNSIQTILSARARMASLCKKKATFTEPQELDGLTLAQQMLLVSETRADILWNKSEEQRLEALAQRVTTQFLLRSFRVIMDRYSPHRNVALGILSRFAAAKTLNKPNMFQQKLGAIVPRGVLRGWWLAQFFFVIVPGMRRQWEGQVVEFLTERNTKPAAEKVEKRMAHIHRNLRIDEDTYQYGVMMIMQSFADCVRRDMPVELSEQILAQVRANVDNIAVHAGIVNEHSGEASPSSPWDSPFEFCSLSPGLVVPISLKLPQSALEFRTLRADAAK